MSSTDRFVPRYYEIEQSLRERIAALRPDDPLPSDAMLVEEFGVSRMTARNAMQRLTQEGLVYRVPGRGTFVAEPATHRQASNLLSFSEEMRRQGREPSSRLLGRDVRSPREHEVARLGLSAGDEVIAVRRVRLADGEPVVVEEAVFSAGLADVLHAADLQRGSLHRVLVGSGHVPTTGRGSLRAEAAGEVDAGVLGIGVGSPLLVELRLILDQDGRPLELTESRYAGDRYALDVVFDVEIGGD